MKIAVNTRLLISGKMEGIGWFMYESLRRITEQHKEHEFIFIFDRPYSEEFVFSENVIPVVVHPQARHPFLWYLFFDWGVTRALKKHKADLFLSPDGWLSLRTKVPSIPVIHDLNFECYPEHIPPLVRKYYHYFFPRFAKKACRIGTVSEFTKQDISDRYGIHKDRIDVLYNGADEKYRPYSTEDIALVRKKYSKGWPYFLFIGLIHPRKNLARLIQAYDQFRKETPSKVKLLVVGSKKWWTTDIKDAYECARYKEDIIFTGRVTPEQIREIIPSALAMTYVSIFEGFGIPILEAMFCDVPVITSNVSSMPEVGGDAAVYVDPFSTESITQALKLVYRDENLRKELIEKGKLQRARFSWQKTADNLWNCIQKEIDKK